MKCNVPRERVGRVLKGDRGRERMGHLFCHKVCIAVQGTVAIIYAVFRYMVVTDSLIDINIKYLKVLSRKTFFFKIRNFTPREQL